MFVVTLPLGKPLTDSGRWTPEYQILWEQLTQNMQQALSDEGFVIPSQSAANIALIEPKALPGTLIFDTDEVNGGPPGAPNGQLKIRLADGTFHAIPNL